MKNGQLDIYKASAGSGKTYTLTHKYLSYLLDPSAAKDAYKHILAVTFTNKATEEMKGRIVAALYELSQGRGDILKGKGPAEKARLQARAKECLTAILHDYSNFQVSTIDKFFQQIFRAFARELGSFSNYRVELRDEEVLSRVVDEMLSGLDRVDQEDVAAVFDSINSFALEQLRYRSKSSYEKQIAEFARLFMKEDFKMKSKGYNPAPKAISRIAGEAQENVKEFEEALRNKASDIMKLVDACGLAPEDFRGRGSSGIVQVRKYADGEIKVPANPLLNLVKDGPDKWFTKTKGMESVIASLKSGGLDCMINDIVSLFDKKYSEYVTSLIVRKNVGVMRIFGGIYSALSDYLKKNNIMLLGETTQALHEMIGSSDTPFIYERVGSWIDHFLLDEFQDFSRMQWANFKPLLEQSLDNGDGNLIVGDVKQSIYRWRGSDWNTLHSGLESDLAGKMLHPDTLLTNYRSDKEIVEFNNLVFSSLSDPANGFFGGDETIAKAYSDCKQEIHSKGGGHVKVVWLSEVASDSDAQEVDEDPALLALKDEIYGLDALGYPRNAIYVLVRTNLEAGVVAARLIADGIEVITDESLVVGASAFVRRIIAVLKYILNPSDKVNSQVICELGDLKIEDLNLSGNSLYDICENIVRSVDQGLIAGEMPYLMTFMDLVLDYMRDYGSDLAGFLDWWGDFGCKQAVSAPKGANAVRIMTIHKAKGLGCPVVIMPFLKMPFRPSSMFTNYMWCNTTSLGAGLLPVEFTKVAGESTFKDDYEREVLNYKMDALNTAYVAFTRAKQELIVFAHNSPKNPGVADALYKILSGKSQWNNGVYEVGERGKYRPGSDAEAVEQLQLAGYNSIPMEGKGDKKRLELVFRGADFFEEDGKHSARQRGIVLHDILSRINTAADIPAAVAAAVESGELPAAERAATEEKMTEMLTSVSGYGWFREGQRVINELSIIDTDGNVHRPDRVVADGTRVTVVDYKFGLPHSVHKTQVRSYVDMLRRMGYENVEGYLWYASEGKIEKVD